MSSSHLNRSESCQTSAAVTPNESPMSTATHPLDLADIALTTEVHEVSILYLIDVKIALGIKNINKGINVW